MTNARRRFVPAAPKVIHIDPSAANEGAPARRRELLREVGRRVLAEFAQKGGKVPMLPAEAQRMMALARSPEVTLREIEEVLRHEPTIVAQILRMANSPFYARGRKLTNLHAAVGLLGTGTLRDLMFRAVTDAHVFRGRASHCLALRRHHGLACALAARATCERLGIDAEYAFLCGLLHDLGEIFVMQVLERDPPEGLDAADQLRLVHDLHTAVGARVAKAWKLPALVVEAIARHHRYRSDERREYSQIGNVIAVADLVAGHLGAHTDPRPVDLSRDAAPFELGLAPADVEAILAQTGEALEGERQAA